MKKNFLYGLSLVLLAFILSPQVLAATLEGEVKSYPNEVARDYVTKINGQQSATQVNWYQLNYYNNIPITITNQNGEVVFNGVTGATAIGGGSFSVTNLPVGTYTVTVIENSLTPVPFSNGGVTVQPTMSTTVQITDESQSARLNWILASKPKRVLSLTAVGTLPGGKPAVSANTGQNLNYREWYAGGDVVTPHVANGVQYIYFKGVLTGDTLGMYSSDIFTVPTLSEAEKAYGWSFVGWRLNQSDRIYQASELTGSIISSDIQLEAVWQAPSHKVTFATDVDKGSINDGASVEYTVQGNVSNVATATGGALPTVVAKEGYTFLGWYKDQTTNVQDEQSIKDTLVTGNIVYYAKYKKNAPVITIGANGNWFIDGVDTGVVAKGQDGKDGKDGQNGQDGKDGKDGKDGQNGQDGKDGKDGQNGQDGKDGKDGQNGQDGKDGKDGQNGQDGKTPVITIGKNGNWFIDGVDTGVSAKGKDAVPPVVTIGANGNWFVNGKDTGVSAKGKDGKDGTTPNVTITANGNWSINGTDTGVTANVTLVSNGTLVVNGSGPIISGGSAGILPKTGENTYLTLSFLGVLGLLLASGLVLHNKKQSRG